MPVMNNASTIAIIQNVNENDIHLPPPVHLALSSIITNKGRKGMPIQDHL